MAEFVDAWQCIGCGKVEAPQTCIGICRDRKVQFVYASEYEQALAEARLYRAEATTFASLIRQLASTTPRNGQWQRSYLALQNRARNLLAASSVRRPNRQRV